jgi:hypothetical protein
MVHYHRKPGWSVIVPGAYVRMETGLTFPLWILMICLYANKWNNDVTCHDFIGFQKEAQFYGRSGQRTCRLYKPRRYALSQMNILYFETLDNTHAICIIMFLHHDRHILSLWFGGDALFYLFIRDSALCYGNTVSYEQCALFMLECARLVQFTIAFVSDSSC